MKARAHVMVEGRVQGVAFRGYTRRRAAELDLGGWVRNLYDGRVEVIAEGEKANIEALIRWLNVGPSLARVENVAVEWQDYIGEFKDFSIAWLDF
jgi:acylphosphatase